MSSRERPKAPAPGVVEFNVGGRIFAAARPALSLPLPLLDAREDVVSESDAIGHTRDSMGRIFLCRDPDVFVHVLGPCFAIPKGATVLPYC